MRANAFLRWRIKSHFCAFLAASLETQNLASLLHALQVSLIAPEKARVLDLLTLRSGQKRFETHIDADNVLCGRQPLSLDFNREGDIPLVGLRAFQADGLDLPLDRTMPNDLHAPDFRDDQ